MSDRQNAGFAKFVPGFDFLQGLSQGAPKNMPQIPPLANWVAPTLDAEELDKRIAELKAVQFWLDQNATALQATIQALEVQKMTLATLKGMNFSLDDMAAAFKPKAASGAAAAAKTARKPPKAAAGAAGMVDPMQLWGALTQQFQQIAAGAMTKVMTREAGTSGAAGARKPQTPARKTGRARSR